MPPSQCVAISRFQKSARLDESAHRPLQLPLGAIHLDESWQVFEYRRRGEEDLPDAPLGKHLFAVAPWIRNPSFVHTLSAALRSGIANAHFDFKVSTNNAERTIHVNIFTLGDMTAWLFISDKSLPPL